MTTARDDPQRAYDVIVVGGGGAGLTAAAVAAEGGARVLVVEAATRTGGSTALSGGVFYAAGTSLQCAAGISDDTAEAMYRYYMTLNQYRIEPALVRRLCDDAPGAFEWLCSLGVVFAVDDLYASGVDKIRRGHRAAGGGAAIAAALEGALGRQDADVAVNTRVEALHCADGSVAGVIVDGVAVTAGAVVLASGGFGADPAMLARLYPDAAHHGDLHWYIGAPTCRGDGLTLGEAAGAALTQPNRGLLLLTPGFARDLESYLPGWLMLVNADGRRFIDETIEYSVLAHALRDQPARTCFGIFDEATRAAARTSEYRAAPNWTADRLAQFVAEGTLVSGETVAALAEQIGVAPSALETAVARYNQQASDRADADFFKPAEQLRPVTTPPFYAARIRAAIICWTGTGLRIDADTHVLDTAGRTIPGLFAAGETTGGMFGDCYAAGGASIANAIVFGRIAGAAAAAYALADQHNHQTGAPA